MLAGEPFPAALKERFSCVARIAGRRAWYLQCNCDARVHRASFFEAGSQGPPCDSNLPLQNPECSPHAAREASAARLSSSRILGDVARFDNRIEYAVGCGGKAGDFVRRLRLWRCANDPLCKVA